jgi:hypothetical protein
VKKFFTEFFWGWFLKIKIKINYYRVVPLDENGLIERKIIIIIIMIIIIKKIPSSIHKQILCENPSYIHKTSNSQFIFTLGVKPT